MSYVWPEEFSSPDIHKDAHYVQAITERRPSFTPAISIHWFSSTRWKGFPSSFSPEKKDAFPSFPYHAKKGNPVFALCLPLLQTFPPHPLSLCLSLTRADTLIRRKLAPTVTTRENTPLNFGEEGYHRKPGGKAPELTNSPEKLGPKRRGWEGDSARTPRRAARRRELERGLERGRLGSGFARRPRPPGGPASWNRQGPPPTLDSRRPPEAGEEEGHPRPAPEREAGTRGPCVLGNSPTT
ncbi:uncharacterized protein LOC128565151 [Nycticebus coucang]|uniref:uncharacterized protein LOC128565151 n=1 Tax=Nycticebus coucang TaxID=9470 RepID=UPI00234D29D5|nr:uncharacterized protein LOC128565151 [Nycticebus coucang]